MATSVCSRGDGGQERNTFASVFEFRRAFDVQRMFNGLLVGQACGPLRVGLYFQLREHASLGVANLLVGGYCSPEVVVAHRGESALEAAWQGVG